MAKMSSTKGKFIWQGKVINYIWRDANSFSELDPKKCTQSYGICFYKGRIIVGRRKKGHWGPIGGSIEKGETFEEALKREVQEESNMRVLKFAPIGYQEILKDDGSSYYQLRFACQVKPIGRFEKDPAGGMDEIKLINPKDYKKYFDWGKVGDRIVSRALEISKTW